MKKELRPIDDLVSCEACGRTILKGERTHSYLAPGGQRYTVCELCTARAEQVGWIRESAHADLPVTNRRAEPRRSLIGRLRRRQDEDLGLPSVNGNGAAPPHEGFRPPDLGPSEQTGTAAAGSEHEAEPYAPAPPTRLREVVEGAGGPRDPRHVRAVPTNAQAKVDRALELFNSSEHSRTVAGLTRTLGQPWVRAAPALDAPSEVVVVVAWELSWYHYRVDLGDAQEPIVLIEKGSEVGELREDLRDWNGSASSEGLLQSGR